MLDEPLLWPLRVALTLTLLGGAIEVGFRVGRARMHATSHEVRQQTAATAGTLLGLVSLLLAFSLGIAEGHYRNRKELVVREATAIRTAWRRADVLSEPYRSETRSLLEEYVQVRILTVQHGDVERGLAHSKELHQRLWGTAMVGVRHADLPPVLGLFLSSVDQVIDLHQDRVAALLWRRTPYTVLWTLVLTTTVCLLVVGFSSGLTGERAPVAHVALVAVLTVVLTVVVDFDHPQQHLFEVGQQALIEVQEDMRAARPPP